MESKAIPRYCYFVAVWSLALVGWVIQTDAAEARAYMTPGFSTGEERPMRLALLPPHADFIKAKAVMTNAWRSGGDLLPSLPALRCRTGNSVVMAQKTA